MSATNSPPTATVTRRGKKSDDNNESNHHVHEDLSDDEVEDVIFQHDLLQSHSSFNADQDDNIPQRRFKPKTHSNNKHERKGKNFNKLKHPSSELNSIHNTQGEESKFFCEPEPNAGSVCKEIVCMYVQFRVKLNIFIKQNSYLDI